METNRSDKRVGVLMMEVFGTAIIMYAMMMFEGLYMSTTKVTLIMMLLAWDLSGGHFNPTITIGVYVSQKKFGQQLVTMLTLLVAQFGGACFGVLLGYVSLIAKDYMETQATLAGVEHNANVPDSFVGLIAPEKPSGLPDISGKSILSAEHLAFTRNW